MTDFKRMQQADIDKEVKNHETNEVDHLVMQIHERLA